MIPPNLISHLPEFQICEILVKLALLVGRRKEANQIMVSTLPEFQPHKSSHILSHFSTSHLEKTLQNWASKCWVFGDHLKASIDCDAGDNQYHSHGHGHGHCLCQKWQSANCCQTQKWLKGDRSGELKKISWDKEIVEHSPITLLLLNMRTTTRKVFLWVLQYIWAGTWDKRSLETEKWWLSHSQNTRRLPWVFLQTLNFAFFFWVD